MSKWDELLVSEQGMQEWQGKLLEMLTEMVAEFDGDGTDLFEHAQGWMVTAKDILPLAQREWKE